MYLAARLQHVHVHTDASGLASLQMNSAPQTAESFSHFLALEMYQGSPAKAIRLRAFAKRKKEINENQAVYENTWPFSTASYPALYFTFFAQ